MAVDEWGRQGYDFNRESTRIYATYLSPRHKKTYMDAGDGRNGRYGQTRTYTDGHGKNRYKRLPALPGYDSLNSSLIIFTLFLY